jgi:hypothetical protein
MNLEVSNEQIKRRGNRSKVHPPVMLRTAQRFSRQVPLLARGARPFTSSVVNHSAASKPLRAAEIDYQKTTITEAQEPMSGPLGPDGDPKMRYFTGMPCMAFFVDATTKNACFADTII